jgi:hypothetical protein
MSAPEITVVVFSIAFVLLIIGGILLMARAVRDAIRRRKDRA